MSTRLDANQVIKKVYDDDTESLRTLATVAVADITFDVNLDVEDDGVTIGQDGENIGPSNPLYTQTTNGNLETTQQTVLAELQTANSSLEAIETAIESIDTDFNTALSTRASESTQLNVLSELQELNSQNIVNVEGVYGTINLSTTPAELKVGASVLENRTLVTLDNTTIGIIYWGYSNTVSSSNFAGRIFKDQQAFWSIGDQVSIYLVISSGTATAHCSEGA